MIRVTRPHYDTDLAWIHHTGFREFAESATPGILAILAKHGIRGGTVVDAGCGSGVLAGALVDAGFRVRGFDASPAMIELARAAAPRASFSVSTFAQAEIPPCDAIVAVGEVLNYATLDAVRAFVWNAAGALRSGGILLFDVAERGAYPPHEELRLGGDDWSVIVVKDSDGIHLTRRVLTFRQIGDEVRRSEEIHVLELYERDALTAALRSAGFRVTRRRSYGRRRLPNGHAVYVAVAKGTPRRTGDRPPAC